MKIARSMGRHLVKGIPWIGPIYRRALLWALARPTCHTPQQLGPVHLPQVRVLVGPKDMEFSPGETPLALCLHTLFVHP